MEEKEVNVPYINIDMPVSYGDKEEIVLVSEAEIRRESHSL